MILLGIVAGFLLFMAVVILVTICDGISDINAFEWIMIMVCIVAGAFCGYRASKYKEKNKG